MASRSIFHKPAGEVAYQRQCRDNYADEGLPPGLTPDQLRPKAGRIRTVSRELASQIILKYEWLGTMSGTRWHFGIFFGPYCAGVVCFGYNRSGGIGVPRMFKVHHNEVISLSRGACVHWAPNGANSKLIAFSLRTLIQEKAGKVCVAYADEEAGEIGTLYQATNWVYMGQGQPGNQFISPEGRKYPDNILWRITDTRGWRKPDGGKDMKRAKQYLLANGWTQTRTNPLHRYAFLLDPTDARLAQLLEEKRKPYPKRSVGGDKDAAGAHSAKPGANPRPTLQTASRF